MEIVVQIIKQLPPFWPRAAVLLALALLLFLPEMRRVLTRSVPGKRRLDHVKHLLEVRKLELDVAALKAKIPETESSILDAEIEQILSKPVEVDEEEDPLAWSERAKFALTGSFSLMVIGIMALWFMGRFSGSELIRLALLELGVALACGLIASAMPSRSRSRCVFRGFLIPALVAALSVAARGRL